MDALSALVHACGFGGRMRSRVTRLWIAGRSSLRACRRRHRWRFPRRRRRRRGFPRARRSIIMGGHTDSGVRHDAATDAGGSILGGACLPRTCANAKANCGPVGDGCGELLSAERAPHRRLAEGAESPASAAEVAPPALLGAAATWVPIAVRWATGAAAFSTAENAPAERVAAVAAYRASAGATRGAFLANARTWGPTAASSAMDAAAPSTAVPVPTTRAAAPPPPVIAEEEPAPTAAASASHSRARISRLPADRWVTVAATCSTAAAANRPRPAEAEGSGANAAAAAAAFLGPARVRRRLWPGCGRLRLHRAMRRLQGARVVRGRRHSQRVRRKIELHGADVCRRECQLRSGGGRVRRSFAMRDLRCARDLRRRWHAQPLRKRHHGSSGRRSLHRPLRAAGGMPLGRNHHRERHGLRAHSGQASASRQQRDPVYNAAGYIPTGRSKTSRPAYPARNAERTCRARRSSKASPGPTASSPLQRPSGNQHPARHPAGPMAAHDHHPPGQRLPGQSPDADQTRLPRKQAEGSPADNIPQTAIATGNVDTLECVLRKTGIDDSQFTIPSKKGRVHIYRANGARMPKNPGDTPDEDALWGDAAALAQYDWCSSLARKAAQRRARRPEAGHRLRERRRARVRHALQLHLALR